MYFRRWGNCCNPFENEIRKQAESNPLIYIHDVLPDLCQLMKQADLSIGAGGATTWEWMFMGVPSLIICTADNQLLTCEALYKEGLIEYAGHVNDIDIEDPQPIAVEDSAEKNSVIKAEIKKDAKPKDFSPKVATYKSDK